MSETASTCGPDLVAEVAEHDAAHRPGDKTHGVGAERRQRAHQRVKVREEQPIEDKRCCRSVQEEVVPLDGSSDEAGERDLDDGRRRSDGFGAKLATCACHDACLPVGVCRAGGVPHGSSYGYELAPIRERSVTARYACAEGGSAHMD